MPFLNFGGNKNNYCNLSDMKFFIKNIKNIKNRYSDPGPYPLWTRIRIHYYGKVDPRIRIRIHVKMRWIRNAVRGSLDIHKAMSILFLFFFSIFSSPFFSILLKIGKHISTWQKFFHIVFCNYKSEPEIYTSITLPRVVLAITRGISNHSWY